MQYRQLLETLFSMADERYRAFHKRLLKNDNINVLGVRVPALRKIAKHFKGDEENLLSFPDEYYEVTFVKLSAVAALKYEDFIKYIDKCVPLIDNWATCDCFSPKCIEKHREEFLPYIDKYLCVDGEFYQRFALTTLLHFYVDGDYVQTIYALLKRADMEKYYYVHMAAAWLVAEITVKYFDEGVKFLKSGALDKSTHNKAIRKAIESFRLSDGQKNLLKELKR